MCFSLKHMKACGSRLAATYKARTDSPESSANASTSSARTAFVPVGAPAATSARAIRGASEAKALLRATKSVSQFSSTSAAVS